MNQDRTERLLQGQTEIARKVFEVVPIGQAWTPLQIKTELERLGLSTATLHVVRGCLRELCSSNLIGEPTREMYRRRAVRNKPAVKPVETPTVPASSTQATPKPATTEAAKSGALDIIASLSSELSGIASELNARAKRLELIAEELEDVALTVLQEQEASKESLRRFDDLKRLMRDLSAATA